MSAPGQQEGIDVRQQQLEILFNSLVDIVFMITVEEDGVFRFLSVNRAFCEATGLQRNQVEGKLVRDTIPEPAHELVFSRYNLAISGRRTIQWEETTVYPAGTKTGIVSVTPVFDSNGKCLMLVGTVHDITARKQAEEENDYIRHQLGERIKELTTLYNISQLMQDESKSTEQVLEEMVQMLPRGWQYPNITEAMISAGDKIFKTPYFNESQWKQSVEFFVSRDKKGTIQVIYTEERPYESEGPFLAEERKLINMLAEMLSSYFVRKGIAEQVQREKDLTEEMINSLPGIFYMFDDTGKYVRWNKNHETVPGYSTEEMANMFPLNFFADDEKGLIAERIGRVFTEGYADAEANFLAKDGRKIPYYFNGKMINYEGRSYLLGVGIDMTEKRKMEQDLRDAEIKFRTLVEKSQVGVYIVQKSKFVYVNPRFAEIFGYAQDELIGVDPVSTIISEESQAASREYVRARLQGEVDSVHYEATGRKKDGSLNRVEFYGSSTTYEGQTTIIGTMVDITERKIAEEALQKSEANLHTLFDTTDTLYTLLDMDFRVISFNHRSFDFVKNELKGELKVQANLVNYFPADRQDDVQQRMKQVLMGASVSYESSYEQKDGSYNWYHVRMIPITNSDRKIFGLMIAVSDITEKKMLEQKILDQKVEEQKKMTRAVLNAQEAERNKIGQELHDNVNQILVGSKIHLGLTGKNAAKNSELVSKSISLIDQAVNEIRLLTRQQVTPRREVSLKDLIQSLVDNLNENASIKTEFVCDTGKEMIKDELKLNVYRIIQEATNNILKHAEATRSMIFIKANNFYLDIVVSDNGKGFDTAITNLRGIGLSNILNRVESYNGTIDIKSSPGEGCRIEVSIPL